MNKRFFHPCQSKHRRHHGRPTDAFFQRTLERRLRSLLSENNHLNRTQADLEKQVLDLRGRLLALVPDLTLRDDNHKPYFSITLNFSRHLLRYSYQDIRMHDLIIGEFRLRLRTLIQDRVSPLRSR